jgi:hypothetical protein
MVRVTAPVSAPSIGEKACYNRQKNRRQCKKAHQKTGLGMGQLKIRDNGWKNGRQKLQRKCKHQHTDINHKQDYPAVFGFLRTHSCYAKEISLFSLELFLFLENFLWTENVRSKKFIKMKIFDFLELIERAQSIQKAGLTPARSKHVLSFP